MALLINFTSFLNDPIFSEDEYENSLPPWVNDWHFSHKRMRLSIAWLPPLDMGILWCTYNGSFRELAPHSAHRPLLQIVKERFPAFATNWSQCCPMWWNSVFRTTFWTDLDKYCRSIVRHRWPPEALSRSPLLLSVSSCQSRFTRFGQICQAWHLSKNHHACIKGQ